MTVAVEGISAAVLVLLGVIDVRRRVVPNRLVLPAAAIVLALRCAGMPSRAPEWIAWSIGTFAVLLAAHVAYPRGLGMGDVKLGLLLGASLGPSTPLALVLALLALAGVGVALRLTGRADESGLPLAPFVAVAAIVVLAV